MLSIRVLVVLALVLVVASAASVLRAVNKHEQRFDYVRGARANGNHMHKVVFAIKQLNMKEMTDILYDVSTMSSPNYGKHLTNEEVGKKVENVEGTNAVLEWLKSQKELTIESQSLYGEYITVKGSVSLWERLFETKFYQFHGEPTYHARSAPVVRGMSYSLPDHIEGHVEGVFHVTSLPSMSSLKPPSRKADYQISSNGHKFSGVVTPNFLREAYDITGTSDGYGSQSVYASLNQTFLPSDLATFQSLTDSYSNPIVNYIHEYPNPNVCYANPDDCGESSLDVQYITTVSENTPTSYWYDRGNDVGFETFITEVASTANHTYVYSISYSGYEAFTDEAVITSFNNEAIKLGVQGVTVFAASGDDGVAGFAFREAAQYCGYWAQWPAASPYITAVGATQNGPMLTGSPEISCSSKTGALITSGGGFSYYNPAPSFQKPFIDAYFEKYSAVISADFPFNSSNRGYPDVSMPGHNYGKCWNIRSIICMSY